MARTDESVEGILSTVTEEEMGKLDRCEGVPAHYLRARVVAKLKDGTEVDAVTYRGESIDGLRWFETDQGISFVSARWERLPFERLPSVAGRNRDLRLNRSLEPPRKQ